MRKKLIHLLGGFTKEEMIESNNNTYKCGVYFTITKMKIFADSLYGATPEEWCKSMYQRIEEEEAQNCTFDNNDNINSNN